jgi:hopanoid biosynthesis associated protein HpnK
MRVIINADDFGRSSAVNTAILRAYERGVLTSASLMVTGEAAAQAAALARKHPGLAVGLHVVAVNGRALLSPTEIPHLVDTRGCFRDDALRAGVYYFFSKAAREELRRELTAQFERFAAFGLPLSHVDGHEHMHMHPTLAHIILPLAEKYGASGFRLPRDDLWLAVRYDHSSLGLKVMWAIIFGLLSAAYAPRLRAYRLDCTRRVFGLMQSGDMNEEYVLRVLSTIRVPSAELYFHPSTGGIPVHLGSNAGDLEALLSPKVRSILAQRQICRVSYSQLSRRKEVPCS